MNDPVFCPKCEGTDHEHSLTNPRIHHPLVRAADYLVSLWKHLHFGFIIIKHNGSDEDYVPENYRCKTCGHRFLSGSTYDGILRQAKELRKKCLFWGILSLTASLFLALAIILDYYAGFTSAKLIWVYAISLVPVLALTYIFFGGIYYSRKEAKELLKEWTEFQNVQAKHTKSVSNSSEVYTPAWKRVQMEEQIEG